MPTNDKDYKRNHNRRRKGDKQNPKGSDSMDNDIKSPQSKQAQEAAKGNDGVFNDLRWYVVSDQILNDAARIPYNIPVGVPFVRDGSFTLPSDVFVNHSFDDAIPGIMVSSIMPVLGDTKDGSSAPVNVAANSLFQKVRSKISGSRTYLPVDMMLYMGAMDSLYCYLTWLTRLYATAFTYHQANRYLARSIIEAQNVDFDDFIDKLTYFRSMVNLSIAKVRALYLPSVLPIFLRHSWMFSHYFIEGDSEKDQIYLHSLAGYHKFTKDDNGWGMLDSVCLDDRKKKLDVSHLIGALNDMIDPIYQDEDFNRISGDMLKTYEGKVFTLSEIPDIVTTKFAYSEEVLLQFKNAKYKQIPVKEDAYYEWTTSFFDYWQDSRGELQMRGSHDATTREALYNYVYVGDNHNMVAISSRNSTSGNGLILKASFHEWSKDSMLSSPHADVTPGENMINSRLTIGIHPEAISDDPGYSDPYLTFGSEWPVCYYLFSHHRNKADGTFSMFGYRYDRNLIVHTQPTRIRALIASQIPVRSAFKYLPELTLIEFYSTDEGATIYEAGRSVFEVDNYALVSYTTIDGLHRAAILGEYNIPELAVQ